jgi:hypothetical protein
MTMTLHIQPDVALTNGSLANDNHLGIIRSLLDLCLALLRDHAAAPASSSATVSMDADEDDQITWQDAEWQ